MIRTAIVWIVLILTLAPASAAEPPSLSDAIVAYGQAEYERSVQLLRPWAEKGDAFAQVLLGKMFLRNLVPRHSCQEARYWFEEAARNGNIEAAFEVGRSFRRASCGKSDLMLALRWFIESDKLGHGDAADEIAEIYLLDPGDANRIAEATHWLLKGVANYDWRAAYNLGRMYELGIGSEPDRLKAFRWYEVARLQAPIYPGEGHATLNARDSVREQLTPAQVARLTQDAQTIVKVTTLETSSRLPTLLKVVQLEFGSLGN